MTDMPHRPIPAIDFAQPAGAPAMYAPDSLHWRIYKNPIALGIGGVAAVLLEFADPRIRSGVWDHSIYKVDPIGRSQRTGMVAMVGVYGPANVARQVIGGVNRMHAKVNGDTPGGIAYRALDPELLDWVSATAAYGFMTAYHRFVAPLTPAEQDCFWQEGADLARLYGVQHSPASTADFMAMMQARDAIFEPHPINREFLDIIQSGKAAPNIPRFLHRALARAAYSLLPPLVADRLGLGAPFRLTTLDRLALKAVGRMAERRMDPASPPVQASLRLGLPGDFLYRKPAEQRRLLAAVPSAIAPAATA